MYKIAIFSFFILCSCQSSNEYSNLIIEEKNGFIDVSYQDKSLLSYAIKTQFPHDSLPEYYKRSGFIHPIKTLKGNTVSEGFPEGHVHQHGLFFAWTKTIFLNKEIDFWNQQDQLGTVRHNDALSMKIEDDRSRFSVSLEHLAYVEGDTIIAIDEEWNITVAMRDGYYIMDWTSTQIAHDTTKVIVEKYKYGGAAFRGTDQWSVKNNYDSICYFMTNEGLKEIDGNHSRPHWASLYGQCENGMAGIAIIQHPSNANYPQFIRVHPEMPYYCFMPAVERAFTITNKAPFISKYRLVVFDGELDAETIDGEMEDYYSI